MQQQPPGGVRFTNEIGLEYSKQTLISTTDFVWQIFQQGSEEDRKNVSLVSLFIDTMVGVAYADNDEIHWGGNDQSPTPGGLIEGIADFVRLKARYVPSHWVQPGQGDQLDKGSDVTARFLDYCESLRSGFVAELNKKMRSSYSDNYFVELLDKTVDQIWSEYKAKYHAHYFIMGMNTGSIVLTGFLL
ncbi:plant basic secretory protein (BSP) family protein [Actinidia rufa]|uniref:Plant basic secretory protein (BSP) family protein n=1 Tax=Actinidia rufa TaxID=165716 RepID=A0A7J0DVZ3_9ERIC|nr:plant basic secretory protein (BSP) family protein [Actinidia rufa]